MTSVEEVATVERQRQEDAIAESCGHNKLMKRDGDEKTVDVNRDQHGNSVEEAPSAEKSLPEQQHMLAYVATTNATVDGGSKKSITSIAKMYQTEFSTSVSPLDIAMQRRTKEKQRRETKRLAKEALSAHHGHSQAADWAAQSKAKDQEVRQKKKDAEDNIEVFKAADLDKKYEVSTESKIVQMEERRRKREIDEHLKGSRER